MIICEGVLTWCKINAPRVPCKSTCRRWLTRRMCTRSACLPDVLASLICRGKLRQHFREVGFRNSCPSRSIICQDSIHEPHRTLLQNRPNAARPWCGVAGRVFDRAGGVARHLQARQRVVIEVRRRLAGADLVAADHQVNAPGELLAHFGMDVKGIMAKVRKVIKRKQQKL